MNECYFLFLVQKNAEKEIPYPQITGKLVVAGQEKYMKNIDCLIKTKKLKLIGNLANCS